MRGLGDVEKFKEVAPWAVPLTLALILLTIITRDNRRR
jgi:hypothetical protein